MTTAIQLPQPSPADPARGGRLGPRLRAVADLCPTAGAVADIGSGHGALALELARRQPGRRCFATEGRPGPAAELRRLLGAESAVRVLEGDGLRPLAGLGCVGAVIAGMGGTTIAALLGRERTLAEQLEWLVLQPAQRLAPLESWLQEHRWRVRERREATEKGHLYQAFLVTPG